MLKAGKPAVGTWLSLGSITAARFLARTGFDWLTVDIEHSLVDWETATHMFGAIADAGCTALARVPRQPPRPHQARAGQRRARRRRADGQHPRRRREDAVAACLYPPRGNRRVGGSVHALNFGAARRRTTTRKANDEMLIVLQCEHIQAVRERRRSLLGAGHRRRVRRPQRPGRQHARHGRQAAASPRRSSRRSRTSWRRARSTSVAAGVHAFSVEEAKLRIEEGWQFIAVNSELKFMVDGAAAVVNGLGLRKSGGNLAKY